MNSNLIFTLDENESDTGAPVERVAGEKPDRSGGFFIKLMVNDRTREIMKDKNAFLLLSLIAVRARRVDGYVAYNGQNIFLKGGEALIGDYQKMDFTKKEYRSAKQRLFTCKLCSFKRAPRGTIARLLNSEVYDISFNAKGTQGAKRALKDVTIQ